MVKVDKGVEGSVVRQISTIKQEPEWMLSLRLEGLKIFQDLELPSLDYDPLDEKLKKLDFSEIQCFIAQPSLNSEDLKDLPDDIKDQIDFSKNNSPNGSINNEFSNSSNFSGLGAQVESEMIFHSLKNELARDGVIFMSMDEAVQSHPDLIKSYFGTIIKPENNKFAALNQAMWSGGSFVYIPAGVEVEIPLHNFYKMNLSSQGQFERTLIVADDNSKVSFIEGCVAAQKSETSLHAGVVEVLVNNGASVRYMTIQNWSKNIWNLVTKGAKVEKNGFIEWIDGNIGSGITMKYPSLILKGDGAKGSLNSFSLIGKDQIIDSGVKVNHIGKNTVSSINSKTMLKNGGKSNFRANVIVDSNSTDSRSRVECSSFYLDDSNAESQTLPNLDIRNSKFQMEHESSLFNISEKQILYLKSRGFSEAEAISLVLTGYSNSFVNELPLEYAVDFENLINIESSKGCL